MRLSQLYQEPSGAIIAVDKTYNRNWALFRKAHIKARGNKIRIRFADPNCKTETEAEELLRVYAARRKLKKFVLTPLTG